MTSVSGVGPLRVLLLFALVFLLHALLPASPRHSALQHAGAQEPAARADPYSGPCVAVALARESAGDMLAAARAPFAGAAAHPVAIIMSLHAPGFPKAAATLEAFAASRPAAGVALYFVFYGGEAATAFRAYVADTLGRPELLPFYRALDVSRDRAAAARLAGGPDRAGFVVAVKSHHGLAAVGSCYRHLSVLDNELEWLRPHDFARALAELAAARQVWGVYTRRHRPINEASTAFFREEDLTAIAVPSRDLYLYSWFSQPSVYEGADVAEFLAYIKYPNHPTATNAKEFAYVSYEWWKVARGEREVVDLSPQVLLPGVKHCGSLESLSAVEQYEGVRRAYPPGPRWLSKGFCLMHPALCVNNSALVLLMHTDRGVDTLQMMNDADCNFPL
jgi:hypothetical protein